MKAPNDKVWVLSELVQAPKENCKGREIEYNDSMSPFIHPKCLYMDQYMTRYKASTKKKRLRIEITNYN